MGWWLATMTLAWKGVILALPGVPISLPTLLDRAPFADAQLAVVQSGVTAPGWVRAVTISALAHCATAEPHLRGSGPGESQSSPARSGKLSEAEAGSFCQLGLCFWIALHSAHRRARRIVSVRLMQKVQKV